MATARVWVFTINSVAGAAPEVPGLEAGKERVIYAKWQLEMGAQGTLHYQGCVKFDMSVRMAHVKKLLTPHAHVEICRAWDKAKEYCGKEDTRIEGPWEIGEDVAQGQRKDIERIASEIVSGKRLTDVAADDPAMYIKYHKGLAALQSAMHPPTMCKDIKVYCLYGPTGCGKTRFIFDNYPLEEIYTVFCNKTPWFDGYTGQRVIVIDEMGPDMMCVNFLKRLLDIYPMMLPVKGGSVPRRATTIFLTSNYVPHQWYPKASHEDYAALARRMMMVAYGMEHERNEFLKSWKEARKPSGGPGPAAAAAVPTQVIEVPDDDWRDMCDPGMYRMAARMISDMEEI